MPISEFDQLSTVSSINTANSPGGLFFVAVHNDQSFAIRRTSDYAATIASVRKAFSLPSSSSRIRLSAQFSDFGNQVIGINEELWADLLPSLKTVIVSVENGSGQGVGGSKETSASESTQSDESTCAKQIVVRVQDTRANIETLHLSLSPNSTIRQLKDLILRHDGRLSSQFRLFSERSSNLDDRKRIHECCTPNKNTFYLSTETQVHLISDGYSKHTITVPTFATVHALKLLHFAQAQDSSAHPPKHPCEQALTCAGEVLSGSRQLGSYPQIVAGCEVFVNAGKARATRTLTDIITLHVREDASLYEADDGEVYDYRVLPESTVLDLRILISNTIGESLARLTLSDWSHKPLEDHYIIGDHFDSMDCLWLTVQQADEE